MPWYDARPSRPWHVWPHGDATRWATRRLTQLSTMTSERGWQQPSTPLPATSAEACTACNGCLCHPALKCHVLHSLPFILVCALRPWLQAGLPLAPGQALACRRGPCQARCRPALSQEGGRPSAARPAVDPWGLQGVAPWAQARQEQAQADHLQVPCSCFECMAVGPSASRLRCPSFQRATHWCLCGPPAARLPAQLPDSEQVLLPS